MADLCQKTAQTNFDFIQSIVQGQMYMLCPLKLEALAQLSKSILLSCRQLLSALPQVDI